MRKKGGYGSTYYLLENISNKGILTLKSESGTFRTDIPLPDGQFGVDIKTSFRNGNRILLEVVNDSIEDYKELTDVNYDFTD